MALLDVEDVVGSVAALLDDPGQTEVDIDYVLPFINLRWSNLVVNLVMLGLQYAEEVAVFDLPANTLTLAQYMSSGQPLASLMKPKSIDWKLQGAPDTEYVPADQVDELDDVDAGSQGVLEYSFQGGTIQVTPSAVTVTVRVRFQAMSTQLVDPTDTMIRGVGDIIAFRVAEVICGVRGNQALLTNCRLWGDEALEDFISMSVMGSQTALTRIPATHPRSGPRRFVAQVMRT